MLSFAARAELIIVLGFADQRLVPWGRICFRNKKPVQNNNNNISLKGLRLGNKLFKKRKIRAGVE